MSENKMLRNLSAAPAKKTEFGDFLLIDCWGLLWDFTSNWYFNKHFLALLNTLGKNQKLNILSC